MTDWQPNTKAGRKVMGDAFAEIITRHGLEYERTECGTDVLIHVIDQDISPATWISAEEGDLGYLLTWNGPSAPAPFSDLFILAVKADHPSSSGRKLQVIDRSFDVILESLDAGLTLWRAGRAFQETGNAPKLAA
ncbi:hypothetical protein [Croceicoccus gelatinilyticus]|uniref:hypothetical protein n=1 Tax=Croceicoccus gelatinilyticus TaxID=2835536 RepID=UPI001BCB68FE|nr:hypothetical protein [Croceicoccus gelatinilyticus]MBS7671784.1 hypothetical protein [Croceicoccus gelatinilyticus]